MGMTGVSNLKARAALLVVGLLATLLALALSACGQARLKREGPYRTERTPCAPANTIRPSSSPRSLSGSARA
jgi:hypothetical protein